jgi:hypothetical protein
MSTASNIDPLAGFPLLRKVALRGDAILTTSAEPISWFWEGIASVDHHIEISGPSYSGKTTLAMMLAIAAANPTDTPVKILGRVVTPNRGGTYSVIVEEENGKRSAADVLKATCEMLGLPIKETLARVLLIAREGVTAHPVNGGNADTSLWGEIIALGYAGHIGALFLDSRARILNDGDSKEESAQARGARILHQAIECCGAPVFVVSHTRKTSNANLSLEDVAGSHQRAAGADVVLLVSADRSAGRIQKSRVTYAKLRDSFDEHPEPVGFAIVKSKGVWKLTEGAADEKPAHERVFEHLSMAGEQTASEIGDALTASGKVVAKALGVLLAEQRVVKKSKKVRGVYRDHFAVAPSFADLAVEEGEEEDEKEDLLQ